MLKTNREHFPNFQAKGEIFEGQKSNTELSQTRYIGFEIDDDEDDWYLPICADRTWIFKTGNRISRLGNMGRNIKNFET